MATRISASQAKAAFSALMTDAASGRRVVIERRGKPLAALVSVNDLELIEQKRQPLAEARPKGALVLVGAWGDIEDRDVDMLVADIYTRRLKDTGRDVNVTT